MSELFDWIKAQEAAGTVDSSGVFTLEKSKAWEKLGAHALPFEHAWALKLVQAAVSAGGGLKIEQRRTESVFFWTSRCSWTHSILEQAMLDPEGSGDRSLDHMAAALRALARRAQLPFALGYEDGEQAVWTGSGFQRLENSGAGHGFRVGVSHFQVGESSSLFSLKNFAANKRSGGIAHVLTSKAHLAPTSLVLDGRPITNLLADPEFGASSLRQPLYLFRVPSRSEVPGLTMRAEFRRGSSSILEGTPRIATADGEAIESELEALAQPCSAVVLVSSLMKKVAKGRSHQYVAEARRNRLVWVCDGVEVLREDLPLRYSSAPMLVVCSADGLETDLSGLKPRATPAKQERLDLVMRGVARCLVESDLDTRVSSPHKILQLGLMTVGGMVFFLNPLAGLAMVGGGGIQMARTEAEMAAIEASFDSHLKELRMLVAQRWPLG